MIFTRKPTDPATCRHKFEGRLALLPIPKGASIFFRQKVYVRDICVKCGKTIEREKV